MKETKGTRRFLYDLGPRLTSTGRSKESILVQDVGFSEVRLSAGAPRVLNFSPLIKGDTRSGPVLGSCCLKSRPLESKLAPLGTKTHTIWLRLLLCGHLWSQNESCVHSVPRGHSFRPQGCPLKPRRCHPGLRGAHSRWYPFRSQGCLPKALIAISSSRRDDSRPQGDISSPRESFQAQRCSL